MPIFTTEVQAAEKELQTLQAARARLETGLVADVDKLELLEHQAGEAELAAFLENGDASPARKQMAALRIAIDGREKARAPLLNRIRGVLLDLAKARADVVRTAAEKVKARLAEHENGMLRLKKALEAYTRAPWTVVIDEVVNTGTGLVRHRPIIYDLQDEYKSVMAEAAAIERTALDRRDGGTVVADNLEGLLKATSNIELLAPTRGPVESWFVRAQGTADRLWEARMRNYPAARDGIRQAGAGPVRLKVHYTLIWDAAGVIDESRSSVQNIENVSGRTAPQLVGAQQRAAAAQGQRISSYMGQ